MFACANLKEANVYVADLLAKQADQEEPLACQRSNLLESIGAEISEKYLKTFIILTYLLSEMTTEDP
jgi:hypothetical protein